MLISGSLLLAANTRSANVLAGEQFEFVPARSLVNVRLSASAVGVRVDLNVGGELQLANAVVPQTNRFPVKPDDDMCSFGARRAERLLLSFLNTTGAGITIFWAIEIVPM